MADRAVRHSEARRRPFAAPNRKIIRAAKERSEARARFHLESSPWSSPSNAVPSAVLRRKHPIEVREAEEDTAEGQLGWPSARTDDAGSSRHEVFPWTSKEVPGPS